MTSLALDAAAQEAAGAPSVVLIQIPADVRYPPLAAAAMLTGKVDVRVGVRPDGSVAEVTAYPRADTAWKLLYSTAVDAATRASFDCRRCTQSSTPHTLAFVFSHGSTDGDGNPPPPVWKQIGDTSEVTVFGPVPVIGVGPPSTPFHKRAARCLWLWHCSQQAYVMRTM